MTIHPLASLPVLVATLYLVACSDSSDKASTQDTEVNKALSAELTQGKQVVENTCIKCHGQGLNGAPILGNKKMWAKRLPQGENTLVDHATNGFAYEMMPPRGGNPDLSDSDIRHAVQYMMSLVQD